MQYQLLKETHERRLHKEIDKFWSNYNDIRRKKHKFRFYFFWVSNDFFWKTSFAFYNGLVLVKRTKYIEKQKECDFYFLSHLRL